MGWFVVVNVPETLLPLMIGYALGTENENLPACVVLGDPEGYTIGGQQLWANAFLPALYQGVEFSTRGDPIHHLNRSTGLPDDVQRANLNFLQKLNNSHLREPPGESELDARIEDFKLAARTQLEAPNVLDRRVLCVHRPAFGTRQAQFRWPSQAPLELRIRPASLARNQNSYQ